MYPENWTGAEDRMLCQEERERRRRERSTQRKQSSAAVKARGALAALKGLKTVQECASPDGVQPTPMAHGHHRLHQEIPDLFSARRATRAQAQEALHAQVSQHIGPRTVAVAWWKKTAGLAT
jgi:hypothetical protein